MIIDGVHVPHADRYKIIVNAGPPSRLIAYPVRHDASSRARQKRKKCRAIVPCEIDAAIKFLTGDGKKQGEVAQITSRYQDSVDIGDGRQQGSAFTGNNERHPRGRKIPAQSLDSWDRQNQITDPLQLKEQNIHAEQL